ncbi:MAG: SDR family NAD(P)-dependent oxidoreductase [Dehalococcoidia bacterium]|jgi:meso-butanediol dehydrogenase/(S,S)-butanediol dehydrogenase/diacetyl reductase
MIDLKDKIAIVTGGARGIGKGICESLSIAGANVIVADLNLDDALKTVGYLESVGSGDKFAMFLDVTDDASIKDMVEKSINEFGRIDILVNNAGIIGSGKWWERDIPNDNDWVDVHAVNVMGISKVTGAVSAYMKDRKYGKIINIASIAGRQGSPDMPHYSTSKAAAISLTQSIALSLGPHDINVNAICPGLLWTPMWEAISKKRLMHGVFDRTFSDIEDLSTREFFEQTVEKWIPMKKEQTPEDIGNLAAFLASDLANNINGQAINVDGGFRTN